MSAMEQLNKVRLDLLDLSTRNRLLNVPRKSGQARTIEVVDERSAEIYRLLVEDGKAMSFLPGRERTADQGKRARVGRSSSWPL